MKIPFQMVQLSVTSANMSGLLFDLNTHGITLHQVHRADELTASFCIRRSQYRDAVNVIRQLGGKIEKIQPASGSILLKGILRRPILMFGGGLLLILTLYLPTRVLFVTVSGNELIPQRKILAVASDHGLNFGAARHAVRSEKVKNQLLSALPELKWVGVNTTGCVAQITVRERAATEKKDDQSIVSSLVASCDGVIQEMTVRSGTPICRVGQAVTKGQLLVSGYSDCGRCIYLTKADAEIFAQTRRPLRLSMLTEGHKKVSVNGLKRKYGLLIGKKRINFYKGSGICDTTCGRMYKEYPLTLPGGFQLPIALTLQTEIVYETISLNTGSQNRELILDQFARSYLETRMIAGKVEQGDYQIVETDEALHLIGQYICTEMIGQTRSEEIVKYYEQTD